MTTTQPITLYATVSGSLVEAGRLYAESAELRKWMRRRMKPDLTVTWTEPGIKEMVPCREHDKLRPGDLSVVAIIAGPGDRQFTMITISDTFHSNLPDDNEFPYKGWWEFTTFYGMFPPDAETVVFVGGPSNQSRQTLRLIGEVDGIKVGAEAFEDKSQDAALLQLARAYIRAAQALEPAFTAAVFNASYGQNNLPYLYRGWDETGDLFRIFVPFSAEGASEQAAEAHTIAGLRGVLEHAETEESKPLPDAVVTLLAAAIWQRRVTF